MEERREGGKGGEKRRREKKRKEETEEKSRKNFKNVFLSFFLSLFLKIETNNHEYRGKKREKEKHGGKREITPLFTSNVSIPPFKNPPSILPSFPPSSLIPLIIPIYHPFHYHIHAFTTAHALLPRAPSSHTFMTCLDPGWLSRQVTRLESR